MTTRQPTLSICVVLYRSQPVVRKFHRELTDSVRSLGSDVEILYYDNSPTDCLRRDVSSGHEAIIYCHDPRNLGFAFANNQLILRARSERIVLLNPDVFGLSLGFWLEVLARDVHGGAWFARLLNEDGTFQDCVGEPPSIKRMLSSRIRYDLLREPTRVGCGIMAFTLTSREVFARVGLLDCDYPLYSEDIDWCVRAGRAGVEVIFDPRLELTHLGGSSADDRWQKSETLRRKYAAERIFINKHFRGITWALMLLALEAKTMLRAR
jgi:GT2 family glycosyltransferase